MLFRIHSSIETTQVRILRRVLWLFLCMILVSSISKAQSDSTDYSYKTNLKGGYQIVYKKGKDLQHLYLTKGRKTIRVLNSVSNGLPHKNLGYVGADFDKYAVLVHSYGSGNPHEIELIRKSNGRNVLMGNAYWIDANEETGVLLYCVKGSPTVSDVMILRNINTGKQRFLKFPPTVLKEGQVLNRINIADVIKGFVVVTFDVENYEQKIKRSYRL